MGLFGNKAASPQAAQQQQAQVVPGALYGVPGLTNPVEQWDTTQTLATTGSGG